MSQLRFDIASSFESAVAQVRSFSNKEVALLEGVQRLISAPMRFVDSNYEIKSAQYHMAESIEILQELVASRDEVIPALVDRARQDACQAVESLQRALLEHGCVSAAADRVGLGILGKKI